MISNFGESTLACTLAVALLGHGPAHAQGAEGRADWPGPGQLFVGTCYQPVDRSPEQVERDIALMKGAGFQVVRMGDLSWDYFEPSEGRFEWKAFDRIMDAMHAAGLKVILDIPGQPAPTWLHHRYPGADIVTQQRIRLHAAERYMDDISDPDYKRLVARLADTLTRRYAGHPSDVTIDALVDLERIREKNTPDKPAISNLWDSSGRKGFDYLSSYRRYVSYGAMGFYPGEPVGAAFEALASSPNGPSNTVRQYVRTPYLKQAHDAFEPLFKDNIDVAVINVAREDLSRYSLVVVPGLYLLDQAAADALREFVAGGGTAIMTAYSAKVNEHNQWYDTPLPGRLGDVFGLRTSEFYDAGTLTTELGGERIKGEIGFYEVLEPSTAEVLARLSNVAGTPPAGRRRPRACTRARSRAGCST